MFIRRNETNNKVLHNCTERFVQLKRIHTSVISYFQLFYSISPKIHTILNYQLPYLTFKRVLSHLTTNIPKYMILIVKKIRIFNTLEKLKYYNYNSNLNMGMQFIEDNDSLLIAFILIIYEKCYQDE